MEQRKSHENAKGNAQAGQALVRQNTDVLCDGGLSRSSDETSVMEGERRKWAILSDESDQPATGGIR